MTIIPQTQPRDLRLVSTDILQNNIQKGHVQFTEALLMMVVVLLGMVYDLKAQAEARTNYEVSSFIGILLP